MKKKLTKTRTPICVVLEIPNVRLVSNGLRSHTSRTASFFVPRQGEPHKPEIPSEFDLIHQFYGSSNQTRFWNEYRLRPQVVEKGVRDL